MDPRAVALLRVGIGVCLFGDLASLLPHAAYLYGDLGIAPAQLTCGLPLRELSLLCVFPGEGSALAILGLGCVAALALTVGLFTRASAATCALVLLAVVLRNRAPLAGQQVLGNFLFLLCLSRCGAAYSIDNVRRCRRLRSSGHLDDGDEKHATYRPIPAWPRWLMILQLTLAYGIAGWAKTGPSYVDGTSFFNLLTDGRWTRVPMWEMLRLFGDNLLRLATWTAWWFERLFPLVTLGLVLRRLLPDRRLPRWLLWPTSRWIFATLSLCFTGSLVVFANLGWFVPATALATVVLFRGEEVGRVVDRLLRRRPAALVPASPRPRSAPWVRALLVAFVLAHGAAMIINALHTLHTLHTLPLQAPAALRKMTHTYGRVTNTFQFWGMFAPNAGAHRNRLEIDVLDDRGNVHAAFDDRALIDARQPPYVFIDRRAKIHNNLMFKPPLWRRRHAAYLCRTWSGADDETPAEIVFRRRHGPTPSPEDLATIPPGQEEEAIGHAAQISELLRCPCPCPDTPPDP